MKTIKRTLLISGLITGFSACAAEPPSGNDALAEHKAEMKAGSVLLYTGSAYHGAGRNSSQMTRTGLIFHYSLGWLRQEENQYLSVPAEMLKTLPEDLLRMMGYQHGAYSLGFIDGGRDPIAAIRPELEKSDSGIDFDDIVEDLDLQAE